jgi:hypothetical protein
VREALKRLVDDGTLAEDDELIDPAMKPRRVQAVRLSPEALFVDAPWDGMQKAAPKQAEALRKLFELQRDSSTHKASNGAPSAGD